MVDIKSGYRAYKLYSYIKKNFIPLAISFCVFVIFLSGARYLVLPHMKVGIPSLPPDEIMDNSWQAFMNGLQQVTGWLILIFIIIWLVYSLLRVIPIIGAIYIRRYSYIFTPCKRSGIFGLFDMIFKVLFGNMTVPDRIANVARGLMDFGKKSTGSVISNLVNIWQYGEDTLGPIKKGPKHQDNEVDKSITDEDNQYINNQYNLCLEENLLEITPDMSREDTSFAQAKNQSARTMCKTKQLQSVMDVISMKI